jgi:hypothetical protein
MCPSDRRILPLRGAGNSARAVGAAGVALVAASLIGGAVSVVAGVNTWSTAWTSQAWCRNRPPTEVRTEVGAAST